MASPIRTGRLILTPFGWQDFEALASFKADPRCWALMLGGVCTRARTARELTQELRFWAAHDVGMWTARDLDGQLMGVTGLHERPDARGIALRFAFDPAVRGHGMAREAAGAVLTDAHTRGRLTKVVAVTRASNIASRRVLGGIGMRMTGGFTRDYEPMLEYESVRPPRLTSPPGLGEVGA